MSCDAKPAAMWSSRLWTLSILRRYGSHYIIINHSRPVNHLGRGWQTASLSRPGYRTVMWLLQSAKHLMRLSPELIRHELAAFLPLNPYSLWMTSLVNQPRREQPHPVTNYPRKQEIFTKYCFNVSPASWIVTNSGSISRVCCVYVWFNVESTTLALIQSRNSGMR